MLLIKLMEPLFAWAARRALQDKLSARELKQLLREVRRSHDALLPGPPAGGGTHCSFRFHRSREKQASS